MREYLQSASEFFGEKFLSEGPSPLGVDWGNQAAQDTRLRILMSLIPKEDSNFSIADVGCGYGRLIEIMHNVNFASYTGYEISKRYLDYAEKFAQQDSRICFSHNQDFSEVTTHDYILMSGLFNKKFGMQDPDFLQYIQDSLRLLATRARKGLAVNFLSSYSDLEKRREDLYYTDVMKMLDFAKRELSPQVSIIHDYGLWDFTLYLRFVK